MVKRKPQANRDKPNIGVVTWPILEAGVVPLQGLLHILLSLSNELYVITGGAARHRFFTTSQRLHLYFVDRKPTANTFMRVIRNIAMQVNVSQHMHKIAEHVDFWIFFFGAPVLLLPMITARCLRKHVILNLMGSDIEDAKIQMGGLISKIVGLLAKIDFRLSSRIIVCSEDLTGKWRLERYRHKISIANHHFLDFNKLGAGKPLSERNNVIGYVGRLSKEKGILNFMEAIPKLLERRNDIRFLIAGDGQLRTKVDRCLTARNLGSKVNFVGWIAHDELPKCLNELRLLVVPSYTEELPTTMLESMACGVLVLATPVGAIPTVIKDGQTGFIMEDNSPECIVENVLRALEYPGPEDIAKNARALVEKEFNYEMATRQYQNIIGSKRKQNNI